MTKVVSFKVRDEIYDQLKNIEGTFRDILEPLIEQHLAKDIEQTYTDGIPILTDCEIQRLRDLNKQSFNHATIINLKKEKLETLKKNIVSRIDIIESYLQSKPVLKNKNLKTNQLQIIRDLGNNYRILLEILDILESSYPNQ